MHVGSGQKVSGWVNLAAVDKAIVTAGVMFELCIVIISMCHNLNVLHHKGMTWGMQDKV